MKILFLGLMFCEESLEEAYRISKVGVSMAPHKFQSNLLKGFYELIGDDITVLNIPPMGSFPKNNRKLRMSEYKWGNANIQLGYLNLPGIKHFLQKRQLRKKLSKVLSEDPETRILIYSLYEPFVSVAYEIKNRHPQTKVYLIQPDAVPGRNDMEKYMTAEAVERGNRLVQLCSHFDGFVLFSKYLTEPLEVGERPYAIVECVCDDSQNVSCPTDGSNKICLYMGALEKSFSILDLARAFVELNQGELWLCGRGDAETEIKELAEKCDRIKYFGYVDAQQGAKLRDQCDFLINPRRPSGTYTLYSFPSKTVEYMLSEKPVIMYKLEAIPDEYDEFLNYLHSDSIYGLSEELREIFDSDYGVLKEKSKRAREFVLHEKNGKKQAERIIELLK